MKLKEISPKARIVAVEPNPEAFKVLRKNIRVNELRNVSLVNAAISSKNGKFTFEIVNGLTDAGSLKIIQNRNVLNERIKKTIVNSLTLERLFKKYKVKKIDLLTLDVEGSELEILKSSKNALKKVNKVIVECHSKKLRNQVVNCMKKMDFKLAFEEKKEMDLFFVKS